MYTNRDVHRAQHGTGVSGTKNTLAKLALIGDTLLQKTESENRYRILVRAIHAAHVCLPPCTVCAMLQHELPEAAERHKKYSTRMWCILAGTLRLFTLSVLGWNLVKCVYLMDPSAGLLFVALLTTFMAGKYSSGGRNI